MFYKDQFQHKFCLKKNSQRIDELQHSLVLKCLNKINKQKKIPKQLTVLIVSFAFYSPFKFQEECFRFLRGELYFNLNSQQDEKYFAVNTQFNIQQNYTYILGNKMYINQKIKVKKIWKKPKTCTQKKLFSFYNQFIDFISGKYLKQMEQKRMKREFIINSDQQEIFKSQLKIILQCNLYLSPQILDLFLKLVSKNYIEIQLVSSQIQNKKTFYVIVEGNLKKQIINGISCDIQGQNWKFFGQKLNIWKNCIKGLSRKPQIVKIHNFKNVYCQNNQIQIIKQIFD